jgi:hypothetical protein
LAHEDEQAPHAATQYDTLQCSASAPAGRYVEHHESAEAQCGVTARERPDLHAKGLNAKAKGELSMNDERGARLRHSQSTVATLQYESDPALSDAGG